MFGSNSREQQVATLSPINEKHGSSNGKDNNIIKGRQEITEL